MKGLDPKGMCEMSLEQKGAYDVVCGMNEAFGLAILWRRVWARKMIRNAVGGEEGT